MLGLLEATLLFGVGEALTRLLLGPEAVVVDATRLWTVTVGGLGIAGTVFAGPRAPPKNDMGADMMMATEYERETDKDQVDDG